MPFNLGSDKVLLLLSSAELLLQVACGSALLLVFSICSLSSSLSAVLAALQATRLENVAFAPRTTIPTTFTFLTHIQDVCVKNAVF